MIIFDGKMRDIGGLMVSRILPNISRRMIGPFIFFDHFGPVFMEPGKGVDVRPHPHIGLATVTYLFEGSQIHRDSLGTFKSIEPGDVNWMSAGRGIVHSERTAPSVRAAGHRLHGIQSWIALPADMEQSPPSFHQSLCAELPLIERGGVSMRLIAGHAFGECSPVPVSSPTFYLDAHMSACSELVLDTEHEERGFYVVAGEIEVDGETVREGQMAFINHDRNAILTADDAAHIMLLGGAAMDGPRHIYWNFVSSRRELIDAANADWRAQRFPHIPGDDLKFIPLPE